MQTPNCEGCGQTHNSQTVIPFEGKDYCTGCYNAIQRMANDHIEEDDGDDHDGLDPDE